jgi:hypothetical protein
VEGIGYFLVNNAFVLMENAKKEVGVTNYLRIELFFYFYFFILQSSIFVESNILAARILSLK